jgi:hypothetical protein
VIQPEEEVFEEVAFIAFHFHWGLGEILDLEHPLRRRFADEIGRITQRIVDEE